MFKRPLVLFITVLILLAMAFMVYQYWYLKRAHRTFENYYAFRGCTELLDRTATDAHCKLANGQTIELVAVSDKWYLAGDTPLNCGRGLCW